MLQLMDMYPDTIDIETRADLHLRRLFCDYLRASLSIMLARTESEKEDQVLLFRRAQITC